MITGVVDTTADFYQKSGIFSKNVAYNKSIDAEYAFITNNPQDS